MSKTLIGIGLVFIMLGLIAWAVERAGLTPGRLPGDIVAGSGGTRFYFPVVTCILLSVVLSVLTWVMRTFRR